MQLSTQVIDFDISKFNEWGAKIIHILVSAFPVQIKLSPKGMFPECEDNLELEWIVNGTVNSLCDLGMLNARKSPTNDDVLLSLTALSIGLINDKANFHFMLQRCLDKTEE